MRTSSNALSARTWGLMSGIVYIVLRQVHHWRLERGALSDGGLLSYDSFYQFAFMQELLRNDAWIYFRNPFGSLDQEPLLFNLYASLLLLLQAHHFNSLYFFDVLLGTAGVTLGSYYLVRLLSPNSWQIIALTLFGSGCAYIFMEGRLLDQSEVIYGGGSWGLTYLINQLSTPEIIYHLIFFFGAYYLLVKPHDLTVVGVTILLIFLHPFTGATFFAFVGSSFVFHLWRQKSLRNKKTRLFLLCGLFVTIGALVFQHMLPSISKDAAFFQSMYRTHSFTVPPHLYLFFLALPILFIALAIFLLTKEDLKSIVLNETFFVFILTSFFCLALGLVGHLGLEVVQPAHWTRAYPFVFLFGAAGMMMQKIEPKFSVLIGRLLSVSLLISFSDQALAVYNVSEEQLYHQRSPATVTDDDVEILNILKAQPSSSLAYFRSCQNKQTIGDLEYFFLARTHHRAHFGHVYFSPYLHHLGDAFRICDTSPDPSSLKLTKVGHFVIFDSSVREMVMNQFSLEIKYEGHRRSLGVVTAAMHEGPLQ